MRCEMLWVTQAAIYCTLYAQCIRTLHIKFTKRCAIKIYPIKECRKKESKNDYYYCYYSVKNGFMYNVLHMLER